MNPQTDRAKVQKAIADVLAIPDEVLQFILANDSDLKERLKKWFAPAPPPGDGGLKRRIYEVLIGSGLHNLHIDISTLAGDIIAALGPRKEGE